jgi:hypothetical protein
MEPMPQGGGYWVRLVLCGNSAAILTSFTAILSQGILIYYIETYYSIYSAFSGMVSAMKTIRAFLNRPFIYSLLIIQQMEQRDGHEWM